MHNSYLFSTVSVLSTIMVIVPPPMSSKQYILGITFVSCVRNFNFNQLILLTLPFIYLNKSSKISDHPWSS